MKLVLYLQSKRRVWWRDHLQSLLPEIDCLLWEDCADKNAIDFAVVWRPPAGGLRQFKNLQAIVSIGAGIDHVLADPELPEIPVIRTTGAELTQRMREYVCLHVLRIHRQCSDMEAAQREQRWRPVITPPATRRQVGIMGLGKLGTDAAIHLTQLGFSVSGWARSKHTIAGVNCYHGEQVPEDFLKRSEILVCLLPLTPDTRNMLNTNLFEQLPSGAGLINAARGEHLVESDLLAALESGQLANATLDVFRKEPLPSTHPFWTHPNIVVTPHNASLIDPLSGGAEIAANLRRFIRGDLIADLTDTKRGY